MPEISDEQRDATLANLRAMNAALEQEAQMRRDADCWRQLKTMIDTGLQEGESDLAFFTSLITAFEKRASARQ